MQWATKTHGVAVSEALYDELNTRHFEKGQKLNSQSMLLDAAEAVGIDAEAAELFLESSEGYTEIEEVQATLRALRINSIPTFIVGGETVVGGAAHARDFVESSGRSRRAAAARRGLPLPTRWAYRRPYSSRLSSRASDEDSLLLLPAHAVGVLHALHEGAGSESRTSSASAVARPTRAGGIMRVRPGDEESSVRAL